jgi:hypothetical protein
MVIRGGAEVVGAPGPGVAGVGVSALLEVAVTSGSVSSWSVMSRVSADDGPSLDSLGAFLDLVIRSDMFRVFVRIVLPVFVRCSV